MTTRAEWMGQAALFRAPVTALDEPRMGDLPSLMSEEADTPSDDEPSSNRPKLRAIFISDLHIGTPGFQAEALLDFLKHHESDMLYLVGDIVDGWQLRRRWFWPQSHNDVVQKLLRRARKGCRFRRRVERRAVREEGEVRCAGGLGAEVPARRHGDRPGPLASLP